MLDVQSAPTTLDALRFTNRFTQTLPADPSTVNRPRQVMGASFSRVAPKGMKAPQLIAYSREVAELLDLSPADVQSDAFRQVFVGNRLLDGMDPFAMTYGGHQFGNWAGQLGDGRAINLGEIINRRGEHWTLQLKGAGPTPYSRTADGLAVLRSSIREFLCSEAMHHLGVPTTRALSLVTTGETVIRDMFYNGNPRPEPGAVVCRVAPSFTRFGNFEIFAARRESDLLRQLVDYTIRADFPEMGEPSPDVYAQWFAEVCRRTAVMIVHWLRVGFVHGVMNTDNMSILGLTIDYGPYGWLEDYDPNWTPNTTDAQGRRYRFGHQPQIAHWNLVRLANAIYPLTEDAPPLEAALGQYVETFQQEYRSTMAAKLGLRAFDPATDMELFNELLTILQLVETDMTIFYRKLARLPITDQAEKQAMGEDRLTPLLDAYYDPATLTAEYRSRMGNWLDQYELRVRRDGTSDAERAERMNAVNPKYVLRNYLAQLAIDRAEDGDYSMVNDLLELLRHPYAEQPEQENFAAKRPDWARQRAGCSMLSCSS
ncbi:MAG: YdiU family protein [Caldilinea sp. CFX5]|nr:YdiU family protein [Caldilinea sp. CFX5]